MGKKEPRERIFGWVIKGQRNKIMFLEPSLVARSI
jgi:hypothetical protein